MGIDDRITKNLNRKGVRINSWDLSLCSQNVPQQNMLVTLWLLIIWRFEAINVEKTKVGYLNPWISRFFQDDALYSLGGTNFDGQFT